MTESPARQQRFAGRRIVVTGASGGVGAELAELFRAEGDSPGDGRDYAGRRTRS